MSYDHNYNSFQYFVNQGVILVLTLFKNNLAINLQLFINISFKHQIRQLI